MIVFFHKKWQFLVEFVWFDDYCDIYIKYIAKLDGIYQYNT